MGYAGGQKQQPTYRSLGDHTEAIEIDFDPRQISYSELLSIFIENHEPCSTPYSRQYRSAVFYHNEQQREQAEAALAMYGASQGAATKTALEPLAGTAFWRAEDYHQKYYLRQAGAEISAELERIYPRAMDYTDSTAVARANGYVGRHGSRELAALELPKMGLSERAQQKLLRYVPEAGNIPEFTGSCADGVCEVPEG